MSYAPNYRFKDLNRSLILNKHSSISFTVEDLKTICVRLRVRKNGYADPAANLLHQTGTEH